MSRYKPSCVKCKRAMEIEKTGIYFVEMFNDPPQPYKIWSADLWRCPVCGHQIVRGFGDNPLMEHYEDGFETYLDDIKNRFGEYVILEYER